MRKILSFILFLFANTISFAQFPQIGDLVVNPDGSKGIVFYLHPDGSGGGMVALTAANTACAWGDLVNIPALPDINQYQSMYDDGYTTTKEILKFQGSATGYAASYVDFANGWYIPAPGQANILFGMSGILEPYLLANGGTAIDRNFWISAEFDSYNAIYMTNIGFLSYTQKDYPSYAVRAIKDFSNNQITYDSTLTYLWNTGDTDPFIRVIPTETFAYKATVTSSAGCIATAEKTIIVNDAAGQILNDTICEGEIYTKYGFSETQTGTYTRTVTQDGCSTLLTLNLTVNLSYTETIVDTICLGSSYTEHGFNITPYQEGDYTKIYHYSTVTGCDSVITVKLHVRPVYETLFVDTVCQGETYNNHGFNLSTQVTAGLQPYIRNLISKHGCDSVVVLNLQVNPVYDNVISDQVCPNKPYTKYNFNISPQTAGTVLQRIQNLTSKNGCDSTVTLNLRVTDQIEHPFTEQICQGSSFFFKSQNITMPGVYRDTLVAAGGCDSIVILTLIVNPIKQTTLYDTVYYRQPYTENGFNLPAQTVIGDFVETLSLTTTAGCDSIVTLNLQVRYGECTDQTTVFNDVVCQYQPYIYNGFNLPTQNEAGRHIYRQELYTIEGCDSTVVLNLYVNKAYRQEIEITIRKGKTVEIEGQIYNTPGVVEHLYIARSGCDSTIVYIIKQAETGDCDHVIPDKFFSPNNDGIRDIWLIENIDCFEHLIEIYDRYGKLLRRWENDFYGWDGMYGGKPVISDDYWYRIVFKGTNLKDKIGHFNLRR